MFPPLIHFSNLCTAPFQNGKIYGNFKAAGICKKTVHYSQPCLLWYTHTSTTTLYLTFDDKKCLFQGKLPRTYSNVNWRLVRPQSATAVQCCNLSKDVPRFIWHSYMHHAWCAASPYPIQKNSGRTLDISRKGITGINNYTTSPLMQQPHLVTVTLLSLILYHHITMVPNTM